jgi:hypothetical protein
MKTLTTLACAAALALPSSFTAAQTADIPLPDLTSEQLEAEYLECERSAGDGMLGIDLATHCSIVYEAFKARAFDGDFERLLAWWRQRQVAGSELDAP